MPIFIPFLIGAGVVSLVGYGGKKGLEGVDAMKRASEIGRGAEATLKRAVLHDARTREALNVRLNSFQTRKEEVHRSTLKRMVDFLDRLDQNARVAALEQLGLLGVSRDEVKAFTAQYIEAGGVVGGALVAVAAGAGASSVTTGLVTAMATAGTGAAISGLSGVAAESAMLAWLGGGTLASGGFGMAAGTAVLGGVAAGPAVAIGGFVLAREGEKSVTKAVEYAANVDREVAGMRTGWAALEAIQVRVDELQSVIDELDARAGAALAELWQLSATFRTHDDGHMKALATAMKLSKALSDLTRVPVLKSDGSINEEIEQLIAKQRALRSGGDE